MSDFKIVNYEIGNSFPGILYVLRTIEVGTEPYYWSVTFRGADLSISTSP